jgi:hypothetical protein
MLIDCDSCAMRDLACGDCVVSALLGAPPGGVEFDGDEQDALGALARGGLLPPLQLVPVTRQDFRHEVRNDPRIATTTGVQSRPGDNPSKVRHAAS